MSITGGNALYIFKLTGGRKWLTDDFIKKWVNWLIDLKIKKIKIKREEKTQSLLIVTE